MESVFLRSVIQATDSTFTGWSANTSAASQAAGTASRRSTRHSITALAACSRTLVTW